MLICYVIHCESPLHLSLLRTFKLDNSFSSDSNSSTLNCKFLIIRLLNNIGLIYLLFQQVNILTSGTHHCHLYIVPIHQNDEIVLNILFRLMITLSFTSKQTFKDKICEPNWGLRLDPSQTYQARILTTTLFYTSHTVVPSNFLLFNLIFYP